MRHRGLRSAYDWVAQVTEQAAATASATTLPPPPATQPFFRLDNPWMWVGLAGVTAAVGTLSYLVWRAK